MQTFNLNSLVAESERGDQRWREFLRVPFLSMGLYRLNAGQADEQQPHSEDAQTVKAIKNIEAALNKLGATMQDVVRTRM